MEERTEAGGGADSQENKGGIRYITEELVLKLAGCQSLLLVRSLNLSSTAGEKHIKFIENLHGCQHLQDLNLNHNLIRRMERLNTLTQLRELQLAHNNIQRIEGLELMSSLQHLNLSYNRIDHVPLWMGKKLHSLQTLHLQHNIITSLSEVSRLRSLSSLSELTLSGNPASSLPHSRLFLLYHLRTLDRLDNQPITPEERGHAHQCFKTEEMKCLQQQVDSSQSELSKLHMEQQGAGTHFLQKEETNQTLTALIETEWHIHTLLKQELHTRSQLLDRTTAELNRAFRKLYELKQNPAFYKIGTNCNIQQEVHKVTESSHTDKIKQVRNTIAFSPHNSSFSSSSSSLQTQEDSICPLQEERRTQQSAADADLQLSVQSEQQLEAELTTPEETKTHIQEAMCCLLSKLSILEALRDEVDETEEIRRTAKDTDELETQLLTLHITDLQHPCVRQLLDKMSRKQSELEGRLDNMLSRIAMETQEIKELEQQLTDGQILANEALQRDLEGIISGLQEYLRTLREQARRAQHQVHSLQAENQNLQYQLKDTQTHYRQLQDTSKAHTQKMSVQQEELSVLQMEAQTLRDRQVESSRHQIELEKELQQLREELARQLSLGQSENDALQVAVDKEKQNREIRESLLQSTINTLQDEKSSLQQIVHKLQAELEQTEEQLNQTRTQLEQLSAAFLDPQNDLDQDRTKSSPENLLSSSVEQLYKTVQQTRTSREQVQQAYNQNQQHIDRIQALLSQDPDQVTCGLEQDQELQSLQEKIQTSESMNRHIQHKLKAELQQSRLQLRDVQQERDALLLQLHLQSNIKERSLTGLNRKLRQLSKFMCDSEQLTSEQLRSTTEQLRALNHTVELLHAQKTVDEHDGSFHQTEHTHRLQDDHTHTLLDEHTRTLQDEHKHTVEELKKDLAEALHHAHRLRQQLDQTKTRVGGQWCFVPPGHSAPSFCSQGTQDSGLGLHDLNSPEGGQQQQRPPQGGGYWVYIPPTHADCDIGTQWRDSGEDSDADSGSRGGTPPHPSTPAAGVSVGLSDSQTPLGGHAWLLCGPPAGSTALHCNIPQHTHKEGMCECETLKEKMEGEKKKLRLETKRLRHTLRQHRSVKLLCDEVECVEKTLLKRRAELRQADRLLLEAQRCIHTTRDQACLAQREADILQHRDAVLLEATEYVRELQEEVEELRGRRQQEEQAMREVEEERRSRDQELQQVNTKIHSAADRLALLLMDCQEAQRHLDSINTQVAQQEQRLLQRKEEHQTALSRLQEVRQEEQRLHKTVEEMREQLLSEKKSSVSAVNQEEQKLATVQSELNTHRAELKRILQELLVEQRALEEVKSKHTQTLQRLHKKKDDLLMKQEELSRTQDKVEQKREELVALQQEVNYHRNDLEPHLKNTKQQGIELQQLQDQLSRKREESSRLQQQCQHLEARRRHGHRLLSALEVELAKQREALSHAQLRKQEIIRDTASTQEKLIENSELLSLLSKRVEEKKKQLQAVEQVGD